MWQHTEVVLRHSIGPDTLGSDDIGLIIRTVVLGDSLDDRLGQVICIILHRVLGGR